MTRRNGKAAACDTTGITPSTTGSISLYFGVVPVFLAFLPYRVLTGQPLTTYHATQLFAAVTVIGIFVLFHMLTKRFFPKLPYGVYLALSAAVSVMSVWYSTAEPALYCTAITAAIALETWSLYFFIRGVWVEKGENRQLLFAALGALLGALVFGCRPPIALANVVVLPMLAVFLKQHKFSWRLLGKLVLAALPYVVVGAALMVYNYVRFDDPFEFGQAYQLTVADQSQYGVTLNAETMVRIFNGLGDNFLEIGDLTVAFPYFRHGGVFMNFPLLLLVFGALRPASLRALKQKKLAGTLAFLGIAAVIITVLDVVWTPYLLERYRMDIYFLMGIACFIVVGIWLRTSSPSGRIALTASAMVLSVLALLSSGLLCLRTITVYYPEEVEKIGQLLVG